MSALQILRCDRLRRARVARAWALAGAIAFAVLPAQHAPAMAAAPAGFVAVCTAVGVAYIPAEPALPAPADTAPETANAGVCHACCPTQAAAPPPARFTLAVPSPASAAAIGGAQSAPVLRPPQRPFSRGPPLA